MTVNDEVPTCRVCHGPVAVWPIEHPEHAICMDCCENAEHPDGEHGHQYEYERYEGHMCRYCAAPPPADWYYVDED